MIKKAKTVYMLTGNSEPEIFWKTIRLYTPNDAVATRLFHIFSKNNICTIGDLLLYPIDKMLHMKNLGSKMGKYVRDIVRDMLLTEFEKKNK